jgi:hypothetical protein
MSLFAVEVKENSHLQKALENEGFTVKWKDCVLLIECPREREIELRGNLGSLHYVASNCIVTGLVTRALNEYWGRWRDEEEIDF